MAISHSGSPAGVVLHEQRLCGKCASKLGAGSHGCTAGGGNHGNPCTLTQRTPLDPRPCSDMQHLHAPAHTSLQLTCEGLWPTRVQWRAPPTPLGAPPSCKQSTSQQSSARQQGARVCSSSPVMTSAPFARRASSSRKGTALSRPPRRSSSLVNAHTLWPLSSCRGQGGQQEVGAWVRGDDGADTLSALVLQPPLQHLPHS